MQFSDVSQWAYGLPDAFFYGEWQERYFLYLPNQGDINIFKAITSGRGLSGNMWVKLTQDTGPCLGW